MIATLLAAALAAGGASNLPRSFEVRCEGTKIIQGSSTQGSSTRSDWNADLHVDLEKQIYSLDGGSNWRPIAWIGDAKTPMFLQVSDEPEEQEILDLGRHVYNFIGVQRRDGKDIRVIEHGACTAPSL
jgi:hypothetical protein